jgi:acyl-CoA hydrolase
VIAENIQEQTVRHTNSCFFTMVGFKDGKAAPVPTLKIKDETQRRRWNKAVKRKEARMKLQYIMKAIENEDDDAFEKALF